MKKVWNITDHPESKVAPSAIMVLGKKIMPGRYVKVEPEQLKNAHKAKKDVEDGLIHIGDKLPDSYIAAKGLAHARLPRDHKRSHGPVGVAKKVVAVKVAKVAKVAEPEKSSEKAKKLVSEPSAPQTEKYGKAKKSR